MWMSCKQFYRMPESFRKVFANCVCRVYDRNKSEWFGGYGETYLHESEASTFLLQDLCRRDGKSVYEDAKFPQRYALKIEGIWWSDIINYMPRYNKEIEDVLAESKVE